MASVYCPLRRTRCLVARADRCASGRLHGSRPKELAQCTRIGHGVTLGIVVKVHVRITPLSGVARQTLGPMFKLSTREADAVRTVMEAHVAKRPNLRRVGRGRKRPADGDDQRTAAIFEDAGDFGTVPGGIAEFEGRAVLTWQPGHKLLKPRRIGTPVGRELVEARPELL